MKYLEDERLNRINALLRQREGILLAGRPGVREPQQLPLPEDDVLFVPGSTTTTSTATFLQGRVEAYTMKRVGSDKKYARQYHEQLLQTFLLPDTTTTTTTSIPEHPAASASETAALPRTSSRKGKRRSASVGQVSEVVVVDVNRDDKHNNHHHNESETVARSPKHPRIFRADDEDEDIEPSLQPLGASSRAQGRRQRALSVDAVATSHPRNPKVPHKNHHRIAPLMPTLAVQQPSSSPHSSWLGPFSNQRVLTDLVLTLNASWPDYDFGVLQPWHFQKVDSLPSVWQVLLEKMATNERYQQHLYYQYPVDHHNTHTQHTMLATTTHNNNFPPKTPHPPSATTSSSSSSSNSHLLSSRLLLVQELWEAMDQVVDLKQCEIYKFIIPNDDTMTMLDDYYDEEDYSSSSSLLWNLVYFFVNKAQKRLILLQLGERIVHQRSSAPSVASPVALSRNSEGSTASTAMASSLPPRLSTLMSPPSVYSRSSSPISMMTTTADDDDDDDGANHHFSSDVDLAAAPAGGLPLSLP